MASSRASSAARSAFAISRSCRLSRLCHPLPASREQAVLTSSIWAIFRSPASSLSNGPGASCVCGRYCRTLSEFVPLLKITRGEISGSFKLTSQQRRRWPRVCCSRGAMRAHTKTYRSSASPHHEPRRPPPPTNGKRPKQTRPQASVTQALAPPNTNPADDVLCQAEEF
jgi:hypothetical protein